MFPNNNSDSRKYCVLNIFDDVHQHCSFTVARHLIFKLTRLILAYFIHDGTALSGQGMCPGWPQPRTATADS